MLTICVALLLAAPAAAADWPALPDWSGDWVLVSSRDAEPRYKPEWQAKRRDIAGEIRRGALRDPRRTCGLPVGMPWMLSLPDVHEWIVRPEGVWHFVENGATVRRIYTDGRGPMSPADVFATYTGDNVGRWEGDTLVVETAAIRDDTWLGPSGAPHSDQLKVTQRIRKVAPDRLRVEAVLEDPVAFAAPLRLTRDYRRLPPGSFVRDFACKVLKTPADVQASRMKQ